MTEASLIQRERNLLTRLSQCVVDRSSAEIRVELDYQTRTEANKREAEQTRKQILDRYQRTKTKLETDFKEARRRIKEVYHQRTEAAGREFTTVRQQVLARYENVKTKAKKEIQDSRWTIGTIFEAGKTGAERQHQETQRKAESTAVQLSRMRETTQGIAEYWHVTPSAADLDGELSPPRPGDGPVLLDEIVLKAEEQLHELHELLVPRLVRQKRFGISYGIFWVVVLAVFWIASQSPLAVGVMAFSAVLVGVVLWLVLARVARNQVGSLVIPIEQRLQQGLDRCEEMKQQATEVYNQLRQEIKEKRNHDLSQANGKYQQIRKESKERRNRDFKQAVERFRKIRTEAKEQRKTDMGLCVEKAKHVWEELKKRTEKDLASLKHHYERVKQESEEAYAADWDKTISDWRGGMEEVYDSLRVVSEANESLFPAWENPVWANRGAPQVVPEVMRFGQFHVDLAEVPNGIPTEERLKLPYPTAFDLPAFLDFPTHTSTMFKTHDEGRGVAVQAMQALMMRLLTAVPPAKVRFTIIDPVGLGENFAAFMHLADFDELLITNKIWTEQAHIEQRLIDLTAHMEVVIQKYLRNQFETIEEYNVQAGEVAEPFRILVVANFPTNFSMEACRRLVSIVTSGARCGVHTLISVDSRQPLPQGFSLADLEEACVKLVWRDQRFHWQDKDFARFPLALEAPPDADTSTRLVQVSGERAKAASRVEVPFEFIAPTPDQFWTADSRGGIQVPLGRAGATKRQLLRLGQGTSQHVLVAGKTGSGKSTLLHALITNLSLLYSPNEIELYLIDFKKGVEFKMYASEDLPHARVIAIESEREFGISVLQRLDAELKQRGEHFRAVGVQDLNGYRQASGQPLPRIMLIVDEFQEFFIEDDKLAQEAAQLLDRLVRQGRAFGLHVLLGSQTLGGAYSLARSTIDQMGVRIALQCSETDGHLILSEDNSAARLLSRPGEAIYNDANGLVEGNNPFQVVWLNEERREGYLRRIHQMHQERGNGVHRLPIVFEGNIPADVTKNPLLNRLLEAPTWPTDVKAPQGWLGEALAIKDPTAAIFRPHSGNNLLILGQYEEMSLGMVAVSLVSLAAQLAPNGAADLEPRVYILDGTAVDSPYAGYLQRLTEALPLKVQLGSWRDAGRFLTELNEEVERRQQLPGTVFTPWFLVINGLQRFRDLRKAEDEFGFGRRDEGPSPARLFGTVLKEGAGLGVHTLAWCDSLNNLQRALDRQGIREFEMRVLFQMSVADSSTLIDTPVASKLGVNRALFYSEEQGRLEKFRPYGVPGEDWLQRVREAFQQRLAKVEN